ncbi:hypothetical protein [Rhodococcus sp. (in: high G+C Gram-positive bacteria)]|uniref:hypothetical protein n=1 Tax=Rhodococcus sp. TaxID=1831 RepID=UPI003B8A73E2
MEIRAVARWEQGWWVGTTATGEDRRARTLEQLLREVEERYRGSANDITVVLTVRYRPDPDWPLTTTGVSWADAMKVFEDTPVDEASWGRELEEERARASNVADDPWEQHEESRIEGRDDAESPWDFRYAQTPEEAENGSWHWEVDGVDTGESSTAMADPRERARRRLAQKRRLRAIRAAIEAGTPTQEIGTRFKLSARELSRIAKRLETSPEMADRSPEDVICERAVGEISDDQMMAELRSWPYTFAIYPDEPLADGMIPGSWNDILNGYDDDLLTEDEIDQLTTHVQPPR